MSPRKKEVETVKVNGYIWEKLEPNLLVERWQVRLPYIVVRVNNFGHPENPHRFERHKGWRIVTGAPSEVEFADRDSAMEAAADTIKRDVRALYELRRQELDGIRELAERTGVVFPKN